MIRQLQPGDCTGTLVWFSTYIGTSAASRRKRPPREGPADASATCDRFVFFSAICWRTKGIETIFGGRPDSCQRDAPSMSMGPLDEYSARVHQRAGAWGAACATCGPADPRAGGGGSVGTTTLPGACPRTTPGEGLSGGVIAEGLRSRVAGRHDPDGCSRSRRSSDDSCGISDRARRALPNSCRRSSRLHQDRDRLATPEERRAALSRALQFDHAVWSSKFHPTLCERLVHKLDVRHLRKSRPAQLSCKFDAAALQAAGAGNRPHSRGRMARGMQNVRGRRQLARTGPPARLSIIDLSRRRPPAHGA